MCEIQDFKTKFNSSVFLRSTLQKTQVFLSTHSGIFTAFYLLLVSFLKQSMLSCTNSPLFGQHPLKAISMKGQQASFDLSLYLKWGLYLNVLKLYALL